MKFGDKVLIVVLIVISSILFVFLNFRIGPNESTYASIQVNGKEIQKIYFATEEIGKKIKIQNEYGYNLIEIGDRKIRVIEADCRDQIDVHQGWISRPGQTVVCLPHKLVIEIKGDEADEGELDHINY